MAHVGSQAKTVPPPRVVFRVPPYGRRSLEQCKAGPETTLSVDDLIARSLPCSSCGCVVSGVPFPCACPVGIARGGRWGGVYEQYLAVWCAPQACGAGFGRLPSGCNVRVDAGGCGAGALRGSWHAPCGNVHLTLVASRPCRRRSVGPGNRER